MCSFSEMSRATKRKHVLKEVLQDDFDLPSDNQQIVKILASRGNNLHQVESADGMEFLISMPTKFRKNVWITRGDFILIEPISEGRKVKGEMLKVLTTEHIKHFKKCGVWPVKFSKDNQISDQQDEDFFVNPNRPPVRVISSSEDSDSDSDDDSQSESNDDSESDYDDDSYES